MAKMPVLFIGHGSPMNAVENNVFSAKWISLADILPRPRAILAISAHWYTDGTRIATSISPNMIYDMYGFPQELYAVQYPVKGSPQLAECTQAMITKNVSIDNTWGIDHGTWSVLCRMYPKADIPVYQLSIDKNASGAEQLQIGRDIAGLRSRGVLIFASGNVVHNLGMVNWNMSDGYAWADEFDGYIKEKTAAKDYAAVVDYKKAGQCAENAFLTPDHFYPLLVAIGAVEKTDSLTVFNNACILGSLSMTSYLWEDTIG